MFRTVVPSLGLWALSAGCSEWPRFSHQPPAPLRPFHEIAVTEDIEEPENDWPNSPLGLTPTASQWIGTPLYAVHIHGTSRPVSRLLSGGSPFPECPQMTRPFPGYYDGDVDWVRFKYAKDEYVQDYGLCLVLGTSKPEIQPIWDLVAYQYQGDCAVGDFITLESDEDETQAAYTVAYGSGYTEPNGKTPSPHNFIEPGHGDFALYISGSNNKTSPVAGSNVEIQYDVYVYPVRDAVGCEELTPDYFPEEAQ